MISRSAPVAGSRNGGSGGGSNNDKDRKPVKEEEEAAAAALEDQQQQQQQQQLCFWATGLEEGLRMLRQRFPMPPSHPSSSPPPPPPRSSTTIANPPPTEPPPPPPPMSLGRVFLIGGAEIYKAALSPPPKAEAEAGAGAGAEQIVVDRILWTRIQGAWECDTSFPEGVLPGADDTPPQRRGVVDVDGREEEDGGGKGEEEEKEEGGEGRRRWVRRSNGEMERWVGEEGVAGVKREGGVEFEVVMLEVG